MSAFDVLVATATGLVVTACVALVGYAVWLWL